MASYNEQFEVFRSKILDFVGRAQAPEQDLLALYYEIEQELGQDAEALVCLDDAISMLADVRSRLFLALRERRQLGE